MTAQLQGSSMFAVISDIALSLRRELGQLELSCLGCTNQPNRSGAGAPCPGAAAFEARDSCDFCIGAEKGTLPLKGRVPTVREGFE